MKKLFSLILCATVLLTCIGGCKNQDGSTLDGSISYSDTVLAENGKTNYKIIIPTNAGNKTNLAASELAKFFRQATYAELELETGNQQYSDSACYISIGENSYSNSANLSYSAEALGSEGYHIETKGNSIFICGGGDSGNLYGVYDLLNMLFGLEFYSNDEIFFETKFKLFLPMLNYSESPDFENRIIYTGAVINDRQFQQYTRTTSWEEAWTGVGGTHSSFKLIGGKDVEAHPDWYARTLAEDGTVLEYYNQLCFTNPEVIDALTKGVLDQLDRYPDRENVMVGIEDNRQYCCCPDCAAMMQEYGNSAAASVIKCVNHIAAEVEEHLAGTGRTVRVVMFAYYGYLDAPVTQTADGTFAPIDDTVVLADNAGVMIAPIDSDYAHSYYETDYNTAERRAFQQWTALTDSIYLWTYTTNFSYMLTPYDAFNAMQENFQFFKEHNVKYFYAQGQYANVQTTGFIDLQTYLQSKLLWDVDENVEMLTDNFFKNYFKEASDPMRMYYEELRAHYAYLRTLGVNGGIFFDIEVKDYWSYALLQRWQGYCDEAYAAIEPLKETDPETYQKVYDRICQESIAIRHLTASFYKGMYSDTEYAEYVKTLKEDLKRLNISTMREHHSVDELPY